MTDPKCRARRGNVKPLKRPGAQMNDLDIYELPKKITNPRKRKNRGVGVYGWRYQKTAVHKTVGGRGVIARLRERKTK